MPQADKVGKMGWGREEWNIQKNHYTELIESERNLTLYGEEKFSKPFGEPEKNPIEQHIEELFWFDEGWDMTYAEKIVYGKIPPRGGQNIGNCVGYSHCLLLASRIAHEILVEGDAEEVLGDFSTSSPVPYIPYSYGAGRCLSGRMCGGGDGSYCSVQLRASQDHGFLPSDLDGLPGPVPQSSSSNGRRWGSNRSILNEWRPKAVAFDLEHSFKCESTDDIGEAIIVHKHPVQICSGWGFRPSHQVKGDGGVSFWVYKPGGSWAHSMQILAVFVYKGVRYFKIGNQWGNQAHRDGWYFIIDEDAMARWIRDADARTIGEIKGRPAFVAFPM